MKNSNSHNITAQNHSSFYKKYYLLSKFSKLHNLETHSCGFLRPRAPPFQKNQMKSLKPGHHIAKIFLFRTHHLWNSPTELTFAQYLNKNQQMLLGVIVIFIHIIHFLYTRHKLNLKTRINIHFYIIYSITMFFASKDLHSSRLDWNKFLSTIDMLPGVPGMSKDVLTSTELQFGGLVH